MKRTILFVVFAAIVGCNDVVNPVTTITPNAGAAVPATDSATAAKRLAEAMTPGPMQQLLASYTGAWTGTVIFWLNEGDKGDTSIYTIDNKMILGGRYLQTTETANWDGQSFEGIGMMGYDNLEKKFVGTWQDSWMTGIISFDGRYDSATRILTMQGQLNHPALGKTMLRYTYKIVDNNHCEINYYGTKEGAREMKFTEMKLTRK